MKYINLKEEYHFDKMTEAEIKGLLNDRLKGLDKCSSEPNKSDEDRNYYQTEYEREKLLLNNPDASLEEISDSIQWSRYIFDANYNDDNINKLIDEFELKENENDLKFLLTFLPINLFVFDESDNGTINNIKINRDEFKNEMIVDII